MDRDPKKVIYIGAYKYISAVIFKYSGPERRTNPITARMIPMKSEIKALILANALIDMLCISFFMVMWIKFLIITR